MPFRILIVGGGIAGLSAAIALKAPDRHITILEQSHLLSEIGAAISLQPNASRILRRTWNLEGALEQANGMIDRGFRIFDTDGAVVNTVPLLNKTGYDGDRIMYHRQDLHESLKVAATTAGRDSPPARVRTCSRVVSCDCEAGIITLENGEEIQGDLIVGADGIHSTLRDFVLGQKAKTVPTGLSAYRLILPTSLLEQQSPEFCDHIKPREPYTSMMMAYSCRLIMGPARNGEIYSLVGLVPDEKMNEDPDSKQSWVSRGDLTKMLETYRDFPQWVKSIFSLAADIGLWQLRDIDPLPHWTRGRVILVGDAAHGKSEGSQHPEHTFERASRAINYPVLTYAIILTSPLFTAMLPTQGQGASQAVEDAEALGAFFDDISQTPSQEQIRQSLRDVFECRYARASLIQQYSREAARPATAKGSKEVKLKADEFMDYNCMYNGAKDWQRRQASHKS